AVTTEAPDVIVLIEPQIDAVEIGVPGAQGALGLLGVDEQGNEVISPVGRLDFGAGFDVAVGANRTAEITFDLAEDSAFGTLEDEINGHLSDPVAAHEASAVGFDPSG